MYMKIRTWKKRPICVPHLPRNLDIYRRKTGNPKQKKNDTFRGGYKNETYTSRVHTFCLVNIERIRFYVHSLTADTKSVSKSNCYVNVGIKIGNTINIDKNQKPKQFTIRDPTKNQNDSRFGELVPKSCWIAVFYRIHKHRCPRYLSSKMVVRVFDTPLSKTTVNID